MPSQVSVLMYYALAITLISTLIGIFTEQFNMLFLGKVMIIVSLVFLVANMSKKTTLKEMHTLFTEKP